MSERERGFTLIEMLVALAILSVSLAVILEVISSTMDRVRQQREDSVAASLVQSLLARVGGDIPLQEGERDGVYSNGYRWHLRVTPFGSADDRKSWPVPAYIVQASVTWRDGAREHDDTLTTLRTGSP